MQTEPPRFDIQSLIVQGMHGLGDNIMQRAVIRQLIANMPSGTVYLDSPWPGLYRDFDPARLKIIRKESKLRTQRKNADREAASFYTGPVPRSRIVTIFYRGISVRAANSTVLAAMLAGCGLGLRGADFSIPHDPEWRGRARSIFAKIGATKPVIFYRPPTVRTEWANPSRNPESGAFSLLLSSIRSRFFLLSVADLEPNVEWLAGVRVEPDHKFHQGELDLDSMLAVMAHSALVFTSPGFATVMAMALGVPGVTVFGGYQTSRSLQFAPEGSPTLFIDPVNPCDCFRHDHACDKRIELAPALQKLNAFVGGLTPRTP